MEENKREKPWKQRFRSGDITRRDVARRLAEMAFGKANDCVRLALEGTKEIGKLDLTLLSEVRRSEKGMVEIRLVDRLRALELLAQMAQEEGSDLEAFLQAMQGGGGA